MNKVIVVAIGGNSLILEKDKISIEHQIEAVNETTKHLAEMIENHYDLVITHGNGPQVGFGLRRAEIAEYELPVPPLDSIGAETQGNIGYMIQQSLKNRLVEKNIEKEIVTIVTQSVVDKNDKAFKNPTKPVGSFMTEEEAREKEKTLGWNVVSDAGRGFRRVVPSPKPIDIVEEESILSLIKAGKIVIGVGGGGIPVIKEDNGKYQGVAAVIDKDYASALLASKINADYFLISTGVEKVCLNFGKENEKQLDKISLNELKEYVKEGHFAKGSMLPKIEAVIYYLENSNGEAIITSPDKIIPALKGESGTRIYK